MAFGTKQHFPHRRLHTAISLISWTMGTNQRTSVLIHVRFRTKKLTHNHRGSLDFLPRTTINIAT